MPKVTAPGQALQVCFPSSLSSKVALERFLVVIIIFIALPCTVIRAVEIAVPLAVLASPSATEYLVYVGTYTSADTKPTGSKGIYAFRFNASNGEIEDLGAVAASEQPSFLASDPSGKYLYAANELDTFGGQPTGAVSAFAINRSSGMLSLLNQLPSHGAAPAHVAVDHGGRYVAVSNYNGGSLAIFPILPDGQLGDATSFVEHHGSSVNKERQAKSHIHQTVFSPDNRFALATDLGLDKLFVYPFDDKAGLLGLEPRVLNITPGFGPRHIAFSPTEDLIYLVSEMGAVVSVIPYDPKTGALEIRNTIRLTPPDEEPAKKWAAEIAVSPSGKYVYASNRGDDFIAVFAVDPPTGGLTRTETVPLIDGKTPRSFALDPAGQWLWDANQDSGDIFLYQVDQNRGSLIPSGIRLKVPAPTCIVFIPIS